MKTYRVMMTSDAKQDLWNRIAYIKQQLMNEQAAKSVWEDFCQTRDSLQIIAGSIKQPEQPYLRERNLKRVNFQSHNYFLLFTIQDDVVIITNVFHNKEDYGNKLK